MQVRSADRGWPFASWCAAYRLAMAMSRRRFLIGGSVAALTAGAGVGVLDVVDHPLVQRGLHHFGLTSSPDRQVAGSGAIERSGTLTSRYMRSNVAWTVSRPSGNQPLGGIIFCLHGRGADHRFAFDTIHVPDVAASVGLRVAVAAVDGGDHSYWHKRNDGTDALSMVLHEFLPASPALWLTPGATAPGAFDGPADFYANDVFSDIERLRGMTVSVACGTGDPFYTATRHLVSKMVYSHTALFGPGYHDASFWRTVAPGQLRVLQTVLT